MTRDELIAAGVIHPGGEPTPRTPVRHEVPALRLDHLGRSEAARRIQRPGPEEPLWRRDRR